MRKTKKAIGSDVLGKKSEKSSKFSVTFKPRFPLDFLEIKFEHEKRENRQLSEEELKKLWQEYIRNKNLARKKKQKPELKHPKKPYM